MGRRPLDQYYEIHRRAGRLNAICASLIWMLTAAAVWPNTEHVIVVLGGMLVTVAFNVWIDNNLTRLGAQLELLRLIVNAASTITIAALIGWPLPCWLWPPFTALAFDASAGRYAFAMFASATVLQDAVGLIHGVVWTRPLTSTLLAVYAWQISQYRVFSIRDMLARSDRQRRELEVAHVQVRTALDELRREAAARQQVELELRSAQRLEAIGRIAAGVAHEINTPIQFVGDNLKFLQDGISDILVLHELDTAVRRTAVRQAADEHARAVAAADAAESATDVGYLTEHLPQAVSQALDGVHRVATIVASMRQFARPGGPSSTTTDINQAILATLTIARHEYKLVADVETSHGELPGVSCNGGEINQVLLNIVVNAAHAVADAVRETGGRGKIRVASRADGDEVEISIADTGTGIPPEIRDHIFDPFFTTKEVGRGTGQGLAIARAVIERHGGKLRFETEVGRGTTFYVRLPIKPAASCN